MSEITSKRSPLYASPPTIYDHHDQLLAGTPAHFLEHLYNDFRLSGRRCLVKFVSPIGDRLEL
jgi:hypothetical protein